VHRPEGIVQYATECLPGDELSIRRRRDRARHVRPRVASPRGAVIAPAGAGRSEWGVVSDLDDSSQALDDAIRVEWMALGSGPSADRNLAALAREIRRTQLAVTKTLRSRTGSEPPAVANLIKAVASRGAQRRHIEGATVRPCGQTPTRTATPGRNGDVPHSKRGGTLTAWEMSRRQPPGSRDG